MTSKRTIRTEYFTSARSKVPSKIIKSVHATNAVSNAVYHMSQNHYEAFLAQVYDEDDGALHAIINYSVQGRMYISFKRNPKED